MTVTTLHDPSHRDALWELEAAFERGDMVTVFGRCTVEYSGRAASTLESGARLLILKPDGSALVHTDEKRTPVNWQPPGCTHHGAVRDGRLRVRSERGSPDETLDVRFADVHQLSAMPVTGGRDIDLVGSEEDLRQRILDEPTLVDAGFEPTATERPSAAGPMDIFGVDSEGRPVIVELKRRRVGPDAVGQLERYIAAVEREEGNDVESNGEEGDDAVEVRGVLVAPSVTDRASELLEERGLEHVAVGPPEETNSGESNSGETNSEESDHDGDGANGTDGDGDLIPDVGE